MSTHRNSPAANRLPGPNGRPNGHGPASTERGGASPHRSRAATDDANGPTVASPAAFPAAGSLQPQACTIRQAYAAAAPPAPEDFAELPPGNRNGRKSPATTSSRADRQKEESEVPPGTEPLPDTPGEFVEEIHRRVDLFEVWLTLVKHKDPKIKQRAIEKLTEMRYKGVAALAEESQPIIFDLPRPKRD